jgi:hypothetical protein
MTSGGAPGTQKPMAPLCARPASAAIRLDTVWLVAVAMLTGCLGAPVSQPSPAVPYSLELLSSVRISSDPVDPTYQNATAALALERGPFAHVALIVDLASTCFPFESWAANPPPPGESWPADCDAFDRNFEIALDGDDDGAGPKLELVRAVTPFGGPSHIEADITDVANAFSRTRTLRAFISTAADPAGRVTGSRGGWTVSARVAVTPGAAPIHVLAVVPLFDGVQDSVDSAGPFPFVVPPDAVGGRIEYRASGHGGGAPASGCIGPAEEFCRRSHTLLIDDVEAGALDAWREDCTSGCTLTHSEVFDLDYCAENPCGAPESVRAPRANWCPGSETAPFIIDAPATAGAHTLDWRINAIAPAGRWRISATYVAYGL